MTIRVYRYRLQFGKITDDPLYSQILHAKNDELPAFINFCGAYCNLAKALYGKKEMESIMALSKKAVEDADKQ